jgi:hypothetical protein
MPSLFAKKEPAAPRVKRAEPKRLPVTMQACEAVVMLVNFAYQVTPWREDSLDELEVEMLTKNLHRMAKKNVYLGNIIVNLTTGAAEGQFVAAIGAVVTMRLAKHNVLPPLQGMMVAGILRGVAMTDPEVISDAVGTGESHSGDRVDGHRQDNAVGVAAEPQKVRGGTAHEVGYASLAEVYPNRSSGPDDHDTGGPGWVGSASASLPGRPTRRRVSESDPAGLPPGGLDGGI